MKQDRVTEGGAKECGTSGRDQGMERGTLLSRADCVTCCSKWHGWGMRTEQQYHHTARTLPCRKPMERRGGENEGGREKSLWPFRPHAIEGNPALRKGPWPEKSCAGNGRDSR